jgi:4'-phosphopantetheinyl transferase EntD
VVLVETGTVTAGAVLARTEPNGVSLIVSAPLALLLRRLLPAASSAVVPITVDDMVLPEEAPLIEGAVALRRREFAAGRRAARAALAAVGRDSVGPLLPDADGVPRWPPGVVGSISHAHRWAIAAVTSSDRCAALGVDLEEAAGLPEELIPWVLTRAERDVVVDDQRVFARQVFCIKEAVYKCVFPLARVPFDFHDVEVTVQDERFTATIHASAASPIRVVVGHIGLAEGHFVATTSLSSLPPSPS